MKKRLPNLFFIASYLLAVGTAALHDHGHHADHGPHATTAALDHAHFGCPQHAHNASNGLHDSKSGEHDHGPSFEHECMLCSFLALSASILTTPQAEQVGDVLSGFVWLTKPNPTLAVVFSWQQRGPPAV